MWKKFKEFAFKGNVVDMAVGVVIGGAFGKIVTSLVADIIMPLLGLITGGTDLASKVATLGEGENAAKLAYGAFLQNIIDFFIIAFSIFIMISVIQKVRERVEARLKKQKEEEVAEEAPAGPTEAELLTEIRDLLKNK